MRPLPKTSAIYPRKWTPSRQTSANGRRAKFENALDGRWREVTLDGTLFDLSIDMMIRGGWQDVILSANPLHRRFDAQMRAIAQLRDMGIADPE